MTNKKGFTLIELLIVIGIMAILAVAVVLVLNPAELLRQARDSQRMEDLDTLRAAIVYYMGTADTPAVAAGPTATAGTTCGGLSGTCVTNASTAVTGTGWVLINLTQASGGSPLSRLPLDPTNSGNYYYAYAGSVANSTYETNGRLESTKYRGLMATDGGDDNTCSTYVEATCFYEVGTDPGLDL